MEISPAFVKEVLLQRGVQALYHANTVATSLSFLRLGGLLSRGYAEELGVQQTDQQSDPIDRAFGIFYDVFFDAQDIHQMVRGPNHYGPVTFAYSVDVLDCPGITVRVTKKNPQHWEADDPESKRYFTEPFELEFHYDARDFGMHITICDMHEPLPFAPYLQAVLLEDPQISETRYFEQAAAALREALRRQEIDIPLTIRQCPASCRCHDIYRKNQEGYTYYRFRTSC